MSDSLRSTKSQLETLPNELFLEIFQYVAPTVLWHFKHLNKRIDSIIGVTKINLEVRHRKDDLGYLSSFTSSQIIRLEIRNGRSFLNLNTMAELRSVTLDFMYLSSRQRKQVTFKKRVSRMREKDELLVDNCEAVGNILNTSFIVLYVLNIRASLKVYTLSVMLWESVESKLEK